MESKKGPGSPNNWFRKPGLQRALRIGTAREAITADSIEMPKKRAAVDSSERLGEG